MERHGLFQCLTHLTYFIDLLSSEMNHSLKDPVCLIYPVKQLSSPARCGSFLDACLHAPVFLTSWLSLGATQLIASEMKRGCSGGILCCWSCSVLSARGAVCQVWLPPSSVALPLPLAGFALVACRSRGVGMSCKARACVGCSRQLSLFRALLN